MNHVTLFCLLAIAAMVIPARAQQVATSPSESTGPRIHVPLADGWRFIKDPPTDADAVALDDSAWEKVTVPHTWNALDGQDGGGDYFRGNAGYRRHLEVTPAMAGKALYLRFQAANRKAAVYVNGRMLGSHAGGQGAFCMDATGLLKPGDNLLAVWVSNADTDIAPLSADFTFYGGLYRPVELLVLDRLHISPIDFGSPGVYISTPRVTANAATIAVRTLVQNTGRETQHATVHVDVVDAAGQTVAQGESPVDVASAWTQEVTTGMSLQRPHLWDGRRDPYMYSVKVSVVAGGRIVDSVTQPLGIRTFILDREQGFILNGRHYDLHGVSRHQDHPDKGWALSDEDHIQDIELIKEMGCTAVRLAHYQHADFFYSLCDKAGIVVWAEIPVVNRIGFDPSFTENARQQYIELIRQSLNHPSICFWSAGNEVNQNAASPDPTAWFRQMSELAHKEDPSRLSTVACREDLPFPNAMDTYSINCYLGWYSKTTSDLPAWIDYYSGANKGRWALTEYGAGASIYFHSEHPVVQDHTEEYQCLLHEAYWGVLKNHPEIWGKFIWNMFDFCADGRAEGDHAGRNDKGLVTFDRKERKDAFYFYKANWSDEPMVHINSKRFAVRGLDKISVKVYSNGPAVSLSVNGAVIGEKTGKDCVFVWENVPLKQGPNNVLATAMIGGKRVEDVCSWTYTPGAPLEVDIAQDDRQRARLQNGPPRRMRENLQPPLTPVFNDPLFDPPSPAGR